MNYFFVILHSGLREGKAGTGQINFRTTISIDSIDRQMF